MTYPLNWISPVLVALIAVVLVVELALVLLGAGLWVLLAAAVPFPGVAWLLWALHREPQGPLGWPRRPR